ncbi:hypothetical protein [Escherichia coli]|uniref:hypothetical protein n=1 Tax=Escherichia coli TaxID=562 RepID=UPI00135DB02C|nr:hypothetical protein [Escherichia coli]MXF07386.1 hypothetical protein [Escherichia coli]
MKKLFKLKEWLTLEETARRLTSSFQEDVSVADCLQLALDGHITISVLIEERKLGMLCKEHSTDKEFLRDFIDFMKTRDDIPNEIIQIANDKIDSYPTTTSFRKYGKVLQISHGVYDLPMIGAERLHVYRLCAQLQGRETTTMINLEGPYLKCGDDFINILEPFNKNNIEWRIDENTHGDFFDTKHGQFIDENNYHQSLYPAEGLGNVTLVFRRINIEDFERCQIDNTDENSSITLNGCLEIIGSMLDTLKNTPSKGRRWTQDALKHEMTDKRKSLSTRSIDDYFSLANKLYKSTN